ncbi:unnamed protein product, partial [Prorocentrum cordatum]
SRLGVGEEFPLALALNFAMAAASSICFDDLEIFGWQQYADAASLATVRCLSSVHSLRARPHLVARLVDCTRSKCTKSAKAALRALAWVASNEPPHRQTQEGSPPSLASKHGGEPGDEPIAAAMACLDHKGFGVRRLAVIAVTWLVNPPSSAIIADLLRCFRDPSWQVRDAAARAVGQMVERGSAQAVAALTGQLGDYAGPVRFAAVVALGQCAAEDDQAVISALAGRLADPCIYVRKAVVKALRFVAPRRDVALISNIAVHLG